MWIRKNSRNSEFINYLLRVENIRRQPKNKMKMVINVQKKKKKNLTIDFFFIACHVGKDLGRGIHIKFLEILAYFKFYSDHILTL